MNAVEDLLFPKRAGKRRGAWGQVVTLDTVSGRIHAAACSADTYGHEVQAFKRPRGCRCRVPCQQTFHCDGRRHEGPRATPWCLGGADEVDGCDLSHLCDTCANAVCAAPARERWSYL